MESGAALETAPLEISLQELTATVEVLTVANFQLTTAINNMANAFGAGIIIQFPTNQNVTVTNPTPIAVSGTVATTQAQSVFLAHKEYALTTTQGQLLLSDIPANCTSIGYQYFAAGSETPYVRFDGTAVTIANGMRIDALAAYTIESRAMIVGFRVLGAIGGVLKVVFYA